MRTRRNQFAGAICVDRGLMLVACAFELLGCLVVHLYLLHVLHLLCKPACVLCCLLGCFDLLDDLGIFVYPRVRGC